MSFNGEGNKNDESIVKTAWDEFEHLFPTDESCIQHMVEQLNEDGLYCRSCGSTNVTGNKAGRVLGCNSCNKKNWLFAGTMFEKIRRAKAYLGLIWLYEKGVSITPAQLRDLAGIAHSTASLVFKKIHIVIANGMDLFPAIPATKFQEVICKRSLETPARSHPFAEQEEIESELLKENEMARIFENFSGEEQTVSKLLVEGPMYFDSLSDQSKLDVPVLRATLTKLEIEGFVKRHFGDKYELKTSQLLTTATESNEPSNKTSILISQFIDYVKCHFQGVSRKYLQVYLGFFWCKQDRNRWRGELLETCFNSPPISVIHYVSPPMLKIPISID